MILSRLYLSDATAREQFQRLHVKDTHGTLWFELQRRKEYLFYQRMDYVDVMMFHPDAWGFPDVSLMVSPLPGESINPTSTPPRKWTEWSLHTTLEFAFFHQTPFSP